jgi:hypothetical protein
MNKMFVERQENHVGMHDQSDDNKSSLTILACCKLYNRDENHFKRQRRNVHILCQKMENHDHLCHDL